MFDRLDDDEKSDDSSNRFQGNYPVNSNKYGKAVSMMDNDCPSSTELSESADFSESTESSGHFRIVESNSFLDSSFTSKSSEFMDPSQYSVSSIGALLSHGNRIESGSAGRVEVTVNNRTVRFSEADCSDEEKASFADIDSGSSLTQVLRERITHLQEELQNERSLRKRKDKNLVKLAKELNKRTSEAHEKETKISSMAATIADLEGKLKTIQRDSAHDLQTYLVACRGNEVRLATLDSTVSELRKQLLQANVECDRLRMELASAERNAHMSVRAQESTSTSEKTVCMVTKKSHSRSVIGKLVFYWLLITFMVVCCVFVRFGVPTELLTIDSLCAPVIPGTTVFSRSGEVEAPWWVPEKLSKEKVFASVCGDRTRTRISWRRDKILIHNLSTGSSQSPTVLWQGYAPLGAKLDSRTVQINQKKGSIILSAPWSM